MGSFIPKVFQVAKAVGYRMSVDLLSFPMLQITAFLILFLLGGQIENQLLSTGAFEVYLNSKLGISQIC